MPAQTDATGRLPPPHPAVVRILVVDDHPVFRDGLIAWISRQPNFVLCGHADSPMTALQAIARHTTDIVLLDLQLREGDGIDLLLVLQDAAIPPQVIIVTHKDEHRLAERSIRAGARGYVLKDEAIDVLFDAIKTVLDGGIHLSAAMRRQFAQANAGETPAAPGLRFGE